MSNAPLGLPLRGLFLRELVLFQFITTEMSSSLTVMEELISGNANACIGLCFEIGQ